MPLWLFLAVVGIILAVTGFAGVGNIVLWVDVVLIVAGLLVTLLGWRRRNRLAQSPPGPASAAFPDEDADGSVRASTSPGERSGESWQRRAKRLGWIVAGLTTLSVVLFGLSIWAIATARPDIVPDYPQRAMQVIEDRLIPVHADVPGPRLSSVIGLAAFLASLLVGMTALQAATAMQVLSRRRQVIEPMPVRARTASRWILGPRVVAALELDQPPEWPTTAMPSGPEGAARRVRCTVLIPAHNEEAVLGRTLASLSRQVRPPDRVLVVADNCTDTTVDIARGNGVDVIETVGNSEHKAGALNQVLSRLLPEVEVSDVFMIMDADSTITADFLAVALGHLEDDPDLIAIGGLFSGEHGARVLGQMQRNEFTRYQRIINRREGRVFVLTGTASIFRTYALQAVAEARSSLIPGRAGDVYDTIALTEDNEITLALKSLGAKTTSPPQCTVTTEVMTTWSDLWRQRSRWQRGAVENVAAYGLTRATLRYWCQQLALGYGVIALNSYLLLMAISLLATDTLRWSPFWLAIGAVFLVERIVTAWRTGWGAASSPLRWYSSSRTRCTCKSASWQR